MEKISLLLADDEPIARAFIKKFIEENDLPVSDLYEAANGEEAVTQTLQHDPDLILMDIRMPGMDGLEAAKAILEKKPAANITMLTAYGEFEYVRTALRAGVRDYLLKPVEHNLLASLITQTVEKKKLSLDSVIDPEIERQHPLVATVVNYIDSHLDSELRLDDIAAAAFISPSHCSRTFKRYSGVSLSDFITSRRLAKAIELLETSFVSMTEIAEQLGFSSSTYFTSWFKKSMGCPPLQFRKKNCPN